MDNTRYIVAGGLIDGSSTTIQKKVCLAVNNGRITNIGPASSLPQEAIIDDYSFGIILPALVDCSVYLARSPSISSTSKPLSEENNIQRKIDTIGRHLDYCHAHGVLGIAEGDAISSLLTRCRISSTSWNMLDICASVSPFYNNEMVPPDSHFFKVNYTGNHGVDNHFACSYQQLSSIIQQKGKTKVMVIANGNKPVQEAIELGCDGIEQGYDMGENNLQNMARKGLLWIPNVLHAKNRLDGAGDGGDICCRFSQRYVAPGTALPGAKEYWDKTLSVQLKDLRLARQLGVKTALGTGSGNPGILHGESMVEEMKLFMKAGYSLLETVASASEHGAKFFGMDNLGKLTVGQNATFVITRGTAQQLPRKLAFLENIYVNGSPSPVYQKDPR